MRGILDKITKRGINRGAVLRAKDCFKLCAISYYLERSRKLYEIVLLCRSLRVVRVFLSPPVFKININLSEPVIEIHVQDMAADIHYLGAA